MAVLGSMDDATLEDRASAWATVSRIPLEQARHGLVRVRAVCARALADGTAVIAVTSRDD